jgi:hypothetical protein
MAEVAYFVALPFVAAEHEGYSDSRSLHRYTERKGRRL